MNIKSLLLGSAAALVAVTGARAADAVVIAEPEPVEYVRVCDTYGTGYYYVPGTEICIKIGGYVRYDLSAGDSPLWSDVSDSGDDTWHKRGRFALRVDARTETELGTLQGNVQINFNWTTGNATSLVFTDTDEDGIVDAGELASLRRDADFNARNSSGIERAWVKLGGFLIGVEDSFFVTFNGYTSGVVNDGLIPYGPFTTHTIQYVWDSGTGFSAGAAVEEGSDGDSAFGGIIQDYSPHVTAGVKYASGVFGASLVGGYDSVQDEFSAKGRIDLTPSDAFTFFVMGGWTDDDNGNGGNYYATWGGDWAIWAGTAIKVNDRLTLNGEFGYNDFGDYSVDADVNITVVPGFVVTPGVAFKHFDAIDDESVGGYVRTQFTF